MEGRVLDVNAEGMRRQFSEARFGQVLATLISLAFLSCGSYVAIKGQPWAGDSLGVWESARLQLG